MDPRSARALGGAVAGTLGAVAIARPTLVHWPTPVRVGLAGLVGTATGAAGATAAGRLAAALRGAADAGDPITAPDAATRGPAQRIALTVAAAASVALAGYGLRRARRQVVRGMLASGRDLEAAFRDPPALGTVSGGPGSAVPYPSVGREGARFVSLPSSPEAIERVTGRPPVADPVRVFVGFDAAGSAEERVALALAELRRTGAFDRAVLMVQAPAGTGFANSTPVEVVELLSGGDSAVVAVGYGLLPSFLSLDRVELASRTQGLLLDAVAAEWESRPLNARPRIVLYGESLGAKVQEAALTGGIPDLDRAHVDAALWVGTPGGRASDAFHAAVAPVSATVDRPDQVPGAVRDPYPRVWFLEHDGDPVVRFRPRLLLHRPDWLASRPRGRNIPPGMVWLPGLTWLTTLVDTLFATDVRPGDFQSMGHDYREDLGAVVRAAYRLPADPATADRLEAELRRAERERAQLIEAGGAAAG